MDERVVSLADAKARLSELTELAAAGEEVIITKRGKPVVRLSSARATPGPVDLEALRALTSNQPPQPQSAGEFLRRLRELDRY